ncbi:hypothetical protein BJF89_08825 [Corynebacterium sp. CNJ-954]|nr:hypothetical protein BJF89_08825 [Corynebacterium sp. CNJ-954]
MNDDDKRRVSIPFLDDMGVDNERARYWREHFPDGDGECPEDWGELGGASVQFIRVCRDPERQRVVGTFVLFWKGGKPFRAGVVYPLKGKPSIPFERTMYESTDWWADGRTQGSTPPSELFSGGGWGGEVLRTGRRRPGVEFVPSGDGDHRWRFPGANGEFKVRWSLLAPALFRLRSAGHQRVSVLLVQGAVQHMGRE